MRAYRTGVDWLYDRSNRDIVEALLVANIRDMTPALAKRSYDLLLADKGGVTRDVALDMDGIRTVLELRSKYGAPKKTLTDPMKYVDLSYYEKAFAKRRRLRGTAQWSGARNQGNLRSSAPTTSIRTTAGPAAAGRDTRRWTSRSASTSGACTTTASPARARALAGSGSERPLLRSAQHPVHHEHRHRRVGARQAHATRCSPATATRTSDFGSAANITDCTPWLHHDHCRAGLGLRGRGGDGALATPRAIRGLPTPKGWMPLGLDVVEPPMSSCEARIECATASRRCSKREVKNIDELRCSTWPPRWSGGVYQDIAEALKPGVRESDCRARHLAPVRNGQRLRGGGQLDIRRALQPHPHNFTDRLIRPGDRRPSTSSVVHGYRTCYYRTSTSGWRPGAAHGVPFREWMDRAISLLQPGVTDRIALRVSKAKTGSRARWTRSDQLAMAWDHLHGAAGPPTAQGSDRARR